MTILDGWRSLAPEAQLRYIKACIIKDAPLDVERGTVAWFLDYHGLDDLAAEAWLHIAEVTPEALDKLNDRRTKPITLSGIVWRAARHAVRTANDSDKRHQHESLDWLFEDYDGTQYQRHIASTADTQGEVICKIWLDELRRSRDRRDNDIINGRLYGLKDTQIAQIIGISPAALCKRSKRLRAAAMA